jgi:ribosomal protein S27AE
VLARAVKAIRELVQYARDSWTILRLATQAGIEPPAPGQSPWEASRRLHDEWERRRTCPACGVQARPLPQHVVRYACDACGHAWVTTETTSEGQ